MFTKAQQLQKSERLRTPAPTKLERLRDPAPKKTQRLRPEVPKKIERLREPVPKKTLRLREDVPKKTERLRADVPKTKERIKEPPYKDKDYLSWFHTQNFGCLVCGSNNIEAHHVLRGGEGRPDDSIVPLCPEHHRGRFSPHGFESGKFSEDYPKDVLLVIARKLHHSYSEMSH
ncbi:MAG: hypothetical protein WC680_11060 [Sulfuricurvum sp.]|jgi:hypothetical protein